MHRVTNWPWGGGLLLLLRTTCIVVSNSRARISDATCTWMHSRKVSWGQRADVVDYIDYKNA